MSERKQELLTALERVYRGSGWKVTSAEDGTLRATGPGGVTWIGLAVVAEGGKLRGLIGFSDALNACPKNQRLHRLNSFAQTP